MKVCRKCGAADRFPSGRCRPCSQQYQRSWPNRKAATKKWADAHPEAERERYRRYHEANREARNAAALERYYENKDHALELNRKWRAANRDKVRETDRLRYAKNREAILEYKRKWEADHPDNVKASQRRYCESNAEKRRENTRKWKRDNPEGARVHVSRRRARLNNCEGDHTASEWKAILKKHSGRCAHCGVKGKMEKDHIIPLSRGGTNFAYNLQPLCRACNIAKYASIESGSQHSLFDHLKIA